VFASDTKPAHSFFSRPTPITSAAPSEIPESPNTNGTVPIPEPTPAEVVVPIFPSKKVHNFFQPARTDAKTTTMKNGWGHGIKEGEEWIPPWPGGDWPVHSGVVDTSSQAGPSRPRRHTPKAKSCDPDAGFWQSFLKQAERSDNSNKHTHRRAKFLPLANGDRESYCDRFRPKTAAQVLGNVTEATYLRDWLSTLVVGNKDGSGPRVIRKVSKRKMKLDDWIVDDIGEFGDEEPGEELEMPEPYDEPDLPMGERPNTYAPLSAWLTNTILLSGPSGSGKSAAVYAAATELGWEVFEVYPGIGKRTGGNLMSLVGDVGKNHMVGKAKEAENTKPSPAALKTFFGSNIKDVDIEEGPPTGSQGEPIEIDDDHPGRTATPPPRLRNPSIPTTPFRDEAKFRQSLILLEEVDILFDEEATFWPAVIALIAESKRPVVMTCNGMSSTPFTLMSRSRTCDVGCTPITGDSAIQTTTTKSGNCTPRLALCSTRPRPRRTLPGRAVRPKYHKSSSETTNAWPT
jgi:DNA polymerase III delta prime subunit